MPINDRSKPAATPTSETTAATATARPTIVKKDRAGRRRRFFVVNAKKFIGNGERQMSSFVSNMCPLMQCFFTSGDHSPIADPDNSFGPFGHFFAMRNYDQRLAVLTVKLIEQIEYVVS